MEKKSNPVRLVVLIALLGASVFSLKAQELPDTVYYDKKVRKAQEQMAQRARTWKVLEERQFVLESYTIRNSYNQSLAVSPATNFVLFDSTRCVIQLAHPQYIGVNGLGGITLDGEVERYELKEKRDGKAMVLNVTVHNTGYGSMTITLTVSGNGYGTASVNTVQGGRIKFQGNVVRLDESIVFEGIKRF